MILPPPPVVTPDLGYAGKPLCIGGEYRDTLDALDDIRIKGTAVEALARTGARL